MDGLGTIYKRFSTVNDETVYKGRTLGGGATWVTTDCRGLSASFSFARYAMEKILPDLNNTPINNIEQDELCFEAGYGFRFRGMGGVVGVRPVVSVMRRDRIGEEIYYDDGSQNYHEISRAKPYEHRLMEVGLGSAVDLRQSERGLSASLKVGLRDVEEELKLSSRRKELTTVSGEMVVGGWLRRGRLTVSCDVLYRHRGTLTSAMSLAVRSDEQFALEDAYLEDYFGLERSQIDGFGGSLRCDFGMPRYVRGVYFRFDWRGDSRREDQSFVHSLCLNMGLVIN